MKRHKTDESDRWGPVVHHDVGSVIHGHLKKKKLHDSILNDAVISYNEYFGQKSNPFNKDEEDNDSFDSGGSSPAVMEQKKPEKLR